MHSTSRRRLILLISVIILGGWIFTFNRQSAPTKQSTTPQTPNVIEEEKPIPTLVKGSGAAIYQLSEDGALRHIPTWADFVALGFENAPITILEDGELARYQLAPLLTQTSQSTPTDAERNPLRNVEAFVLDPATHTLWIGSRFAGVFACPTTALTPNSAAISPTAIATIDPATCQQFTTFSSALLDNAINALLLDKQDGLWVASSGGVSLHDSTGWHRTPLAPGATERGALALAQTSDGTLWVGGDGYLAWHRVDDDWNVYTAIEQPLLADQFAKLEVDDAATIWFRGAQRNLSFDGVNWRATSLDQGQPVTFALEPLPPADVTAPPQDFPDPHTDYTAWLQQWPRPPADNGRCMHFVQASWLTVERAQVQIARLQQLNVRWTVVPYANHYQLRRLAPLFAQAAITVIWRPFVRPYETYDWWQADITYLRSWGLPPYMQIYNEPTLAQEWDDPNQPNVRAIDHELYLRNLESAIREVYEAGGYVGLQSIDKAELRLTLQHLAAVELEPTFDRLFFVPHPYGLNHPPNYAEDESSVLGFLDFAKIFEEEIGFVPMMIAGEGGWRPGERQDGRYPAISEAQHRDYHVEVFEWFRNGKLSNGQPLPDSLFAFCPWLIADANDPAAWFDSSAGDRAGTIAAVEELTPFSRRSSWDQ